MADLLAKVRARFPALALDERLTHVQLEEALRKAGFPLEYDTTTGRFRPPAIELSRVVTSSSTSVSGHGPRRSAGIDPRQVLAGKMAASVERGGFLALTLRGTRLPGAAESLAAAYPVLPVHVNREFLTALRALSTERGQDWDKVRKLDGRFSETGQVSRGLASYVAATWDLVRQRLAEQAAGDRVVLFLHHAGLLARYFDEGGHDLLTGLQNAARRAPESPHGLWLLCPGESAQDAPHLDKRIVEVIGDAERVVLSGEFLDWLRAEGSGAA
jgi:hypothetical protein